MKNNDGQIFIGLCILCAAADEFVRLAGTIGLLVHAYMMWAHYRNVLKGWKSWDKLQNTECRASGAEYKFDLNT